MGLMPPGYVCIGRKGTRYSAGSKEKGRNYFRQTAAALCEKRERWQWHIFDLRPQGDEQEFVPRLTGT